jgi:ERF superfamily
MKTSEQTNKISAALAKAQGLINNPGKTATNPHFKSHYADLSAGINAIRDGMSASGIATIQTTRVEGEVLMLDTRLAHSSGQWFEAEWPVCKLPAAPQQIGSSLTYARRYSLFGIAGIAGEDDDGNAANAAPTPALSRVTFISPEEVELIDAALEQLGPDQEAAFLKFMKVGFVSAIPADQFKFAQEALAKKLRAAEKAKAQLAEAAE